MITSSYIIYLMNHVTFLNNTCGWLYELSCNRFEKIPLKLVWRLATKNLRNEQNSGWIGPIIHYFGPITGSH